MCDPTYLHREVGYVHFPGIWVVSLTAFTNYTGSASVPVSEPYLKGSFPFLLLAVLSLEAPSCHIRSLTTPRPPTWKGGLQSTY